MDQATGRDETLPTELLLRALRWALLALCGYAFLRTAWLCDDAYITFRVVDNFVHGYGLRWNVAERVQAFTHPLWMFALAVPYALTREIYYTSLSLSLALSGAAVWWIVFRIARTPAAGVLGLAILASSKAFVDYSTSGLENPLTHLLLVLFVARVARGVTHERDGSWASAFVGLALVNRLDTGLLVLPALAWSLRDRRGTKLIAPLALVSIPLLLWLAFATLYYGFPWPNTAQAKLDTGLGLAQRLGHGLAYGWNSLSQDPLTLVTIAAATVTALASRAGHRLALALGPLLYLGYVAWIGGDFMSGRFFTGPLLVAVALLVSSEHRAGETWRLVAAAAVLVAGLLVPYPVLLSGSRYGLERAEDLVDDRGIADERGYYYWMTGLLNGSDGPRPRNADVTRIRAWRRCGHPVAIEGAIGFLGFVGGPGLHVIDYHGLADPLLSRLPVVVRDPLYEEFCEQLRGRSCRDAVRVGHFTRTIPPGYVSWILGHEDRFADPGLQQFVEKLAVVTRGPLFDRRRLREVLRLNLGQYDDLLRGSALERYQAPPWDEVISVLGNAPAAQAYRGRLLEAGPEAERALRSALAGCPEDTDAAVNLAIVLWLAGRDTETLEVCQRALDLDPRHERAWNGLGHAYARLGQADAALAAFDRTIELDPTMKEAYHGRAMTCLEAGRWTEARDAFEIVTRLAPRDAEALAKLATVHARLGDVDRALAAWIKAASLGSTEAREAIRKAGASP